MRNSCLLTADEKKGLEKWFKVRGGGRSIYRVRAVYADDDFHCTWRSSIEAAASFHLSYPISRCRSVIILFFYFSFISFLNIFSLRTSLNRHEKIPKKEDDKIYSIDCVYIFRDLSEQPSIDDWYLIPNQAGNCHVLRTVRYQRKNETKIARIVWFYSTDPFYPYLLFWDDDDVDKQQFSWMDESNTPMAILVNRSGLPIK